MLFAAEQEFLQKYADYLEAIPPGGSCPREVLQEMVDGYACVLRQLRSITKLSDRTTETLHHSQQELIKRVRFDALTGVYSRGYMGDRLKEYVQSPWQGTAFCFMMVDVDYFKKYNDLYGHPLGDVCLKTVASTLSECISGMEGFVARYGGEEFAVVLPKVDEETARGLADKLLLAVAEKKIPHEDSSVANHVTVSIGCVTGTLHEHCQPKDYIELADKALYQSKFGGRNRVTRQHMEEVKQ